MCCRVPSAFGTTVHVISMGIVSYYSHRWYLTSYFVSIAHRRADRLGSGVLQAEVGELARPRATHPGLRPPADSSVPEKGEEVWPVLRPQCGTHPHHAMITHTHDWGTADTKLRAHGWGVPWTGGRVLLPLCMFGWVCLPVCSTVWCIGWGDEVAESIHRPFDSVTRGWL